MNTKLVMHFNLQDGTSQVLKASDEAYREMLKTDLVSNIKKIAHDLHATGFTYYVADK